MSASSPTWTQSGSLEYTQPSSSRMSGRICVEAAPELSRVVSSTTVSAMVAPGRHQLGEAAQEGGPGRRRRAPGSGGGGRARVLAPRAGEGRPGRRGPRRQRRPRGPRSVAESSRRAGESGIPLHRDQLGPRFGEVKSHPAGAAPELEHRAGRRLGQLMPERGGRRCRTRIRPAARSPRPRARAHRCREASSFPVVPREPAVREQRPQLEQGRVGGEGEETVRGCRDRLVERCARSTRSPRSCPGASPRT